jgi:hypothetical protein
MTRGSEPLTISDICLFIQTAGLKYGQEEIKAVQQMSVAYMVQLNKRDKGEPSPVYIDKRTDEERAREVSNKFKALARRKNGN